MVRTRKATRFGGMVIGVVAAGVALGGDLDPPPGSLTQTMKTLDQVEPRIAVNDENTPGDTTAVYLIGEPGSYYLTANVTGVSGKNGISITAPGVVLDLNGFSLIGVEGAFQAVYCDPGACQIRNGTVRSWRDGITCNGSGTVVERICVSDCSQYGIQVGVGVISHCTVQNGWTGISGGATIIRDCVAVENSGFGILLGSGGVVSRCVSLYNQRGISVGNGGIVEDSRANDNADHGIEAGPSGLIRSCQSQDNGDIGIRAEWGTRVEGCAVYRTGGVGIQAYGSVMMTGCEVFDSGSYGIRAAAGCVVVDCDVSGGDTAGIDLDAGGGDMVVRNCRISGNDGWGIRVRDRCLIEGNHITHNGIAVSTNYAGIILVGTDSVVRDNVVIGNDQGIIDAGSLNVIADNIEQSNVALP